jgi:hypothetical protein
MTETLSDLGYAESASIWRGASAGDDRDAPQDRTHRFYGKYRAVVVNNVDPLRTGRLMVESGDTHCLFPTGWAMPCVPIAGMTMGAFLVPPLGAGVWVEFEHGNPDKPIWVGGYWGRTGEAPPQALIAAPGVPTIVFETVLKHLLAVSDAPVAPGAPAGGVLMQSGASSVAVDPTGVRIIAPTVTITGPLNVNAGALTVT